MTRLQPATVGFSLSAVQPQFSAEDDFAAASEGGSMRSRAVAVATALAACAAALPAPAQETADPRTAEEMIEVARDEWRSPNLQRCPEAQPGEIVVCAEDDAKFRVESPIDEAIRKGEPVPDGIPRAPYVLGLPECGVEVVCHRIGRAPEPPLMIDLTALPNALPPEEAALVFRAEDLPAEPATPGAASPAAAP
jgi:hypothetical protein